MKLCISHTTYSYQGAVTDSVNRDQTDAVYE